MLPKDPGARYNLGLAYLGGNRLDDAKATFSDILRQDANNYRGHYGLGLVLLEQGQYQPALDEFKKVDQSGKTVSVLYFEIGRCYSHLKMYDDAIAAYSKEKEKTGDDPDLENALAEAYQAKGMTQQAEEARNKAAQLRSGATR